MLQFARRSGDHALAAATRRPCVVSALVRAQHPGHCGSAGSRRPTQPMGVTL